MKLKGLTKLALSGVALAAVAATLGTSTYAWYVSNSVATVAGMSGATAGTESGNVMVCQLTAAAETGILSRTGNWGNKLTEVTLQNTPNLNPVSKDVTGFTPETSGTGWHDKDLNPVQNPDTTAYGYYAFGLWSTDATSIDVQFGVANTTSTFKYQTAYANVGTGGLGVNDTFTVDALNALRVELFQYEFKDSNAETATLATAMASTAIGQYCPADTFYKTDLSAKYAGPTTTPSGNVLTKGDNVDAHKYFKEIMNEDPKGGTSEATATALTSGKQNLTIGQTTTGTGTDAVTTNNKYIIVLRYWLEGTDKECFDSCIGQTFAFNLEFTVHSGN